MVPFRRVHALLIDGSELNQAIFHAFEDHLTWLEAQASAGMSYTCLFHGKPIFSFGIVSVIPGVGEAWMLPDISLSHHTRPFARRARYFFEKIGTVVGYRRIQCTVKSSDFVHRRFAWWLGFEIEGTLRKYLPDENDCIIMSRIY